MEIIFLVISMKKNTSSFLILFVFITSYIIILTGCNNNISDKDIKSKIEQELDYLDAKIVNIINKLNNISLENYVITSEEISLGEGNNSKSSSSQGGESAEAQQESNGQSKIASKTEKSNITSTKMEPKTVLDSSENNIDWKTIKSEIETINEAWAVIILDLSNVNINGDDILNFSSILDECILNIKDENKENALINLAKLYSIIPNFEDISSSRQKIKRVKSYIINANSFLEQNDWIAVEKNMVEAEKEFKNLTEDIEYIKEKAYKVNRTYVLIKELQNSLAYKDKKIYLLKYKNLMESINVL